MKFAFYLFLIILSNVFSVLPVWNLKNTSIDLLPHKTTSEYHEYTIINSVKMYELTATLKKKLSRKADLSVHHANNLELDNVDKGAVTFEYFESYYKWSSNQILCPKGIYKPYKVNGNNYEEISYNNTWLQNNKTDLKCYYHRSGGEHLLSYYFMNGENYFLEFSGTSLIENSKLRFNVDEMFDFKLENRGENNAPELSNSAYPFMALVKIDGYIKIIGTYL